MTNRVLMLKDFLESEQHFCAARKAKAAGMHQTHQGFNTVFLVRATTFFKVK